MQVSVKLVVFWHYIQEQYCSYCPALQCSFGRGKTIEKCTQIVRDKYLLWYLKTRKKYTNLQHYGWQVTDNEVIPPIFSNEECVQLTEHSYEMKIEQYQIIEIHVELPKI
jgi:hypothetical protein